MKLRLGEWVVLAGSGLIAAFAMVVGVLIYLKPPPVEYRYLENALARDGEAIYRREGCRACHRLFGTGATYGPRLDGIGSRRSADWLLQYLQDPKPGVGERSYRVSMPSYSMLQSVELNALVAYLQGLRAVGVDGAPINAPASQ